MRERCLLPSRAVVRATPDSIFCAPRTSSRVTERKGSAVR